ncbi:hypothetical protein HDV05_005312 [Chytridiales sp. JEL 0842]|nr:hypothetical protein HDV05_005312 [Chytridiales sp. JEL 0842]
MGFPLDATNTTSGTTPSQTTSPDMMNQDTPSLKDRLKEQDLKLFPGSSNIAPSGTTASVQLNTKTPSITLKCFNGPYTHYAEYPLPIPPTGSSSTPNTPLRDLFKFAGVQMRVSPPQIKLFVISSKDQEQPSPGVLESNKDLLKIASLKDLEDQNLLKQLELRELYYTSDPKVSLDSAFPLQDMYAKLSEPGFISPERLVHALVFIDAEYDIWTPAQATSSSLASGNNLGVGASFASGGADVAANDGDFGSLPRYVEVVSTPPRSFRRTSNAQISPGGSDVDDKRLLFGFAGEDLGVLEGGSSSSSSANVVGGAAGMAAVNSSQQGVWQSNIPKGNAPVQPNSSIVKVFGQDNQQGMSPAQQGSNATGWVWGSSSEKDGGWTPKRKLMMLVVVGGSLLVIIGIIIGVVVSISNSRSRDSQQLSSNSATSSGTATSTASTSTSSSPPTPSPTPPTTCLQNITTFVIPAPPSTLPQLCMSACTLWSTDSAFIRLIQLSTTLYPPGEQPTVNACLCELAVPDSGVCPPLPATYPKCSYRVYADRDLGSERIASQLCPGFCDTNLGGRGATWNGQLFRIGDGARASTPVSIQTSNIMPLNIQYYKPSTSGILNFPAPPSQPLQNYTVSDLFTSTLPALHAPSPSHIRLFLCLEELKITDKRILAIQTVDDVLSSNIPSKLNVVEIHPSNLQLSKALEACKTIHSDTHIHLLAFYIPNPDISVVAAATVEYPLMSPSPFPGERSELPSEDVELPTYATMPQGHGGRNVEPDTGVAVFPSEKAGLLDGSEAQDQQQHRQLAHGTLEPRKESIQTPSVVPEVEKTDLDDYCSGGICGVDRLTADYYVKHGASNGGVLIIDTTNASPPLNPDQGPVSAPPPIPSLTTTRRNPGRLTSTRTTSTALGGFASATKGIVSPGPPTPTIREPEPTPQGPIVYTENRTVLSSPISLYPIFYGSFPNSTAPLLVQFLQGLSGSPYWSSLKFYTGSSGLPVSDTLNVVGTPFQDMYSIGKDLQPGAMEQIIMRAIRAKAAQGWKRDKDGIYIVFAAKDVLEFKETNVQFCVDYCGYHTLTPTFNLKLAMVGDATACPGTLPPLNSVEEGGGRGIPGCMQRYWRNNTLQSFSVNRNQNADSMASILAHELAETATNFDDAWRDPATGYEAADKCAPHFLNVKGFTPAENNGGLYQYENAYNLDFGVNRKWLIQSLWSGVGGEQGCTLGIGN